MKIINMIFKRGVFVFCAILSGFCVGEERDTNWEEFIKRFESKSFKLSYSVKMGEHRFLVEHIRQRQSQVFSEISCRW